MNLLTDMLVLDLLMDRKNFPFECILQGSGSNSINHFLVTVISGERDLCQDLSCAQGEVRPLKNEEGSKGVKYLQWNRA